VEIQRYVSRPTGVEASEPLTPANVDEIWKWISSNGGWAQVLPPGYERGLVVETVSGTKVDVPYGARVLLNPAHRRPDFWPCDPEVFDAKYELDPESNMEAEDL
jgi:hypothetical protein